MRDLKASFGRWQAGLADVGWNSLYWDNHDQPRAVSRFGDDSPEFRRDSATCLATLLHLHRGTPYVYQGQELGMANYPFATVDDFRDLESVNHFAPRWSPARTRRRAGRAAADEPGQRAHAGAVGRLAEHAGFTTGTPWLPVNPDHVRVERRRAARRPAVGARPLPAADRAAARAAGGRARRLHDAAARARGRVRVHPLARRRVAARRLQRQPRRRTRWPSCCPRRWTPSWCWATCRTPGPTLRPWEARVLRLRLSRGRRRPISRARTRGCVPDVPDRGRIPARRRWPPRERQQGQQGDRRDGQAWP